MNSSDTDWRHNRLLRHPALPFFLVAVAAGLAAFWALTRLDPLFREAIAPWRTPLFRAVMEWVTWFGQGWVLGVLALVVALAAYRLGRPELVRAGVVAVPALIVSGLAARVIKILVARPRPTAAAGALDAWWPSFSAAYNSFPSGHATSAFTLAAVFAVVAPSARWWLYALAGLIAFSRVAVDAHFVSDVVAGGLLGWVTGRLAMNVAERRWPRGEGARAA